MLHIVLFISFLPLLVIYLCHLSKFIETQQLHLPDLLIFRVLKFYCKIHLSVFAFENHRSITVHFRFRVIVIVILLAPGYHYLIMGYFQELTCWFYSFRNLLKIYSGYEPSVYRFSSYWGTGDHTHLWEPLSGEDFL